MNWQIKSFEELSNFDLYQILKLRAEVFVVEQECIYQDLDGYDEKALHLLGIEKGQLKAYARFFKKGEKYADGSSIGRVLVAVDFRNQNVGKELMNRAIQDLKKDQNNLPIIISAQCYLNDFYQNLGFKKVGKSYLEDNIPHQKMKFP